MPPLKEKIETFLNHQIQNEDEVTDVNVWLLNKLFTTAPFPIDQTHQIGKNVTLNKCNRIKSNNLNLNLSSKSTKYEWMSSYTADTDTDADKYGKYTNDTTDTCDRYTTNSNSIKKLNSNSTDHLPQTPSNTCQLLNAPSSLTYEIRKRPIDKNDNDDKDDSDSERFKRIARRLNFNE